MLASARVLFQPTTPCLSILGRELRFGFNAEECLQRGVTCKAVPEVWGSGLSFQLSVLREQ